MKDDEITMETIKSFTSLEQSRKLAEILPIESTDMSWVGNGLGKPFARTIKIKGDPEELCGCWSLAALLGVLPMITKGKDTANPFIAKASDNEYYVVYATLTKEVESSVIYDNPVDACYEMIIYLHELKML